MVEANLMMFRFSSERIVSARGKRSAVMVLFWAAEIVCILPLAFLLPSSKTALLFTVGLIGATSGSIFAVVLSRTRMVMLEVLNATSCGVLLWGMVGNRSFSFAQFSLLVVALCTLVITIGGSQLPSGPVRMYLAAQQGALGSTLICWVLVQQVRSNLALTQTMRLPDPMAFRFLFLGPLAFACVVFLSGFWGWNRSLLVWSAVCAGQLAMGFLGLSAYLNSTPLKAISFILIAGFIILLAAILIPDRVLNVLRSRIK